MHHQVGVGDAGVDFLDAADRQDVAGGLAGELVRAVRGADGDGQCVQLGGLDEVGGLLRIGQQHGVVQHADGADAVFFAGFTGFQRAQAAQFAFHGHADGVGQLHHLAGDVNVVVVLGRGLAVFAQRAVHHHRREAQVDRALADRRRLAVVLVHHHGDVRVGLDRGFDQVAQEVLAGVFAGARRGLHDHRSVDLVGRLHDGLHLLEVVHVEGRQAVAVLGCVVQQLAHRNEWHV
ncbi:hypothetical protein D9M72_462050 [compost metagenome]